MDKYSKLFKFNNEDAAFLKMNNANLPNRKPVI